MIFERMGRRTLSVVGGAAVLVALGASVPPAPQAGAVTAAPYTVAIAGCFEAPAPFGLPADIGAYVQVQAYGLPSSAYVVPSNGIPNTEFYVVYGNQAQPGGTPWPAAPRNGVPSGAAAVFGPGGEASVQVAYITPQNTIARLPVVHVTIPDGATCATSNVTSISTPSGSITAPVVGIASTNDNLGYWLAGADGRVYGFGDAPNFLPTGGALDFSAPILNHPIVGMAATPSGNGYWLVASDGGIFTYGDAGFYGSTGGLHLNEPIVGMAATPDGRGYWLVASDGGIFAFGDAKFYGSMGASHLNKPVVGMAVDQATGGYWLVASDGGIFTFNATFEGSTGAIHLNQPIVGMEAASDGSGYRLVASDGGVFCFNEPYSGSTGNLHLNQPIIGIGAAGDSGYWLAAQDGGIFSFAAPFYGSTG